MSQVLYFLTFLIIDFLKNYFSLMIILKMK